MDKPGCLASHSICCDKKVIGNMREIYTARRSCYGMQKVWYYKHSCKLGDSKNFYNVIKQKSCSAGFS